MNAFHFPIGESLKNRGLKIKIVLNTGAACSIITYRAFLDIAQFRQPTTAASSEWNTKTYSGNILPLVGHTTLSFIFDSEREDKFQLQKWATKAETANIIGIEFCRQ